MTSRSLRLNSEHVEFAKDVVMVIVNYTPISGVIATYNFGKKWIADKRGAHRFAAYVAKSDRRNFIKARSRRIKASYASYGWSDYR